MRPWTLTRPLTFLAPLDLWLWAGSLGVAVLAGVAHFADAHPVARFVLSLGAVAVTSGAMGRAVDQLGGRMRPAVIGSIQALIGNVPELIICIMALRQGLITVVQAAIIGSAINLLLLGNGLAFMAGGLKHGSSLRINPDRSQITRVMLILLVTILLAPAMAVSLNTPAAAHADTMSFVAAVVLLAVFGFSLPTRIRVDGEMAPPEQHAVDVEEGRRPWPLPLVLAVMGTCGLMIGLQADWFTDALIPAVDALGLSTAFVGLFIVSTVGNLGQIAPAVQLSWRGDADTAAAITMEGALQVVLMLAPLLTILAPLLGAGSFSLIFPPMMIVSTIVAVVLVVFVTIDGKINAIEGAMLLALYAVLGSLFWWG